MTDTFNLATTYLHLDRAAQAVPLPVTGKFWSDLASGRIVIDGWLVGIYPMTGDWAVWERHPAGSEVLTLLSGAIEVILDLPQGPRRVPLRARGSMIVPQGVWHTANVLESGDLLAITFGEGTDHRPRDIEADDPVP